LENIATSEINPRIRFTPIIISFLFLLRFYQPILDTISIWLYKAGSLPLWWIGLGKYIRYLDSWKMPLTYVFLMIGVILYKGELSILWMDRFFMILLIIANISVCWNFFLPFGWIAGLLTVFIGSLDIMKRLSFKKIARPTWIYIYGSIFISFIGFMVLINPTRILTFQRIFPELFSWEYPSAIFEELFFRGFVWMLFSHLKISAPKIIIFQALLFWIAHLNYIFTSPFTFWLFAPIVGLLLGIIVWRSKSLVPSSLVHIVLNTSLLMIFGSS
jgi:hypothetical protein